MIEDFSGDLKDLKMKQGPKKKYKSLQNGGAVPAGILGGLGIGDTFDSRKVMTGAELQQSNWCHHKRFKR